MRKIQWRFVKSLIPFLIIIICLIPEKSVKAEEHTNVLFISSYSPNLISFNDQYKGIVSGLGENSEVQVEYMDSKTFESEENEKNFYNLLKYKINNYSNIDAIILGDDAALEFGLKYKDELFKDIPMVFFGVSNRKNIDRAKEYKDISGVIEIESIDKNLELITKFHKNYKNILMITDSKENSKRMIDEFYSFSSKHKNYNFSYICTADMYLKEFKELLSNLDKDTAILLTYANRFKDEDIAYYSTEKTIDLINASTSVPIYSTLSYGIGEGYVGGYAICHYEQGKKAAEIVNGILQGENPESLYVLDDSTNRYVFDYRKLKQFKINEFSIPKESKVLNKPLLKKDENKGIVYSIMLAFFGMFCVILALIIFVINDKEYTKKILMAKDLAEEANKAKNNFISNISHELRTPVAVIMSSNQLVKLKSKDKELIEKKHYEENLKIVNQNCYRLLRLINNIIDVAKVDSKKLELELSNVNIVDLLERIVLSVVPYGESKGIQVVFDTTDEELITAVDSEKIERIVLNLISNAIKFTEVNGHINVNVIAEKEWVIFTVEDTGIGIDENHIDKIFNKFTQVDNTFMRKNEGSGIGLSIVKSFVELHGGEIFVESKINEGSKFTVKLPIRLIDESKNSIVEVKEVESNAVIRTKIEFSDIYL